METRRDEARRGEEKADEYVRREECDIILKSVINGML